MTVDTALPFNFLYESQNTSRQHGVHLNFAYSLGTSINGSAVLEKFGMNLR